MGVNDVLLSFSVVFLSLVFVLKHKFQDMGLQLVQTVDSIGEVKLVLHSEWLF